MKKTLLLIASIMVMHSSGLKAQTAMEIAADMYPGWNLGNTLEAGPCPWFENELDCETAWQDTKTTQEIIDYVKSLGFRSVRIPCSWYIHMDKNYTISSKWMDRVQEVVDYCIKDSLYVILNDHYDNGWIERSFSTQTPSSINKNNTILSMMWRQIANRFRDYDHHLLFAGMNEPEVGGDNSHDEEGEAAALAKYQQTFVNTVRQTGGNNNTRILVVQAPLTNIGLAAKYNIIPTDITPSALMLEVHFYSPFEFCQLEEDKEWGYRAFYWGEGNYVDGSKHNSTWGGEDLIQKEMRQMKNKYSSKGYPVVLGEFGSLWRDIPQGENQDVHNASIRLWYKTVCKYAIRNGIIPFVWDTNFRGYPSGTIVDRKNLCIYNQFAYDGMMEGCQSERWPPFTTDITAPAILSTDDKMYDLNGRQLTSEPTKGLYIRNGKKVGVK